MEKLKQDLSIFILDDSNVHQTTSPAGPLAALGKGLSNGVVAEQHDSPLRISFTPPPIRPLLRGVVPSSTTPPPLTLNRIVPIGSAADDYYAGGSDQLIIIDTSTNGTDAIQLNHVASSALPPGIDSNHNEFLICDEDYFPNNEIPGTNCLTLYVLAENTQEVMEACKHVDKKNTCIRQADLVCARAAGLGGKGTSTYSTIEHVAVCRTKISWWTSAASYSSCQCKTKLPQVECLLTFDRPMWTVY